MDEPTDIPTESESETVDHLAWLIVGDIFTANGIYVGDEDNQLRWALADELTRLRDQMRAGRKPPTQKEQLAAAARLRGYGCWMHPYDPNPTALEVFVDTGHDWHKAHTYAATAQRPYPGKAAAQAVARLAIERLQRDTPIETESSAIEAKPRRARKPRS